MLPHAVGPATECRLSSTERIAGEHQREQILADLSSTAPTGALSSSTTGRTAGFSHDAALKIAHREQSLRTACDVRR